jgi:hypothetical protein
MRVTLARLAFAAWAAWLLALSIMACLSYCQVLHPSFLFMGIPLAVQVLCTVALLAGGVWRAVRGPRRANALTWTLFGTLPALWMAAYVEYGVIFVTGRNHRPTPLIRFADSANSLVAEPYLRVRYPYQHEGERFVLWSDSPKRDASMMAAMDAHVRALEEPFGRQPRHKLYWVRGPVWGIEGRGGSGWAIGARYAVYEDALSRVDRHEAAHFVLDEFLPFDNETPKLLHEGWAELHSTPKPESQWPQCWAAQQSGRLPSLRALTGPDCYFNSIPPMYSLGSVLVEYILKRFGHEKFLELCSTCREATFADDVERVLGLSLDELDRAYQQDLAQRELPLKEHLLAAKLADGVDRARWRRIVEDACAEMDRLAAAARQASVTVVDGGDFRDKKDGPTRTGQHRFEYFFDGERYANRRFSPGDSDVCVRTPDVFFSLQKKSDEPSWQLHGYSARNREDEVRLPPCRDQPMFLWRPPPWWPNGSGLTITDIRPRDAASQIVRASFVQTYRAVSRWARMQGWIDLDPKYGHAIIEKKFDCFDEKNKRTSSSHLTINYETIDGRHVPKTVRWDTDDTDGGMSRRKTTVESCRFAPPPAKVFELASYGDIPSPQPPPEPRPPLHVLACTAVGFTLLTLLLAVCLKLTSVVGARPARGRDPL